MGDASRRSDQARLRLADQVSFVVYGTIAVLAAVGGLALEAQALRPRQAAAVLIVVTTGLGIAQGLGVAVLFAAGLATAYLAGSTGARRLVMVITLPCVGLLIVGLEVAAHEV